MEARLLRRVLQSQSVSALSAERCSQAHRFAKTMSRENSTPVMFLCARPFDDWKPITLSSLSHVGE
ncbi:hypothetical protein XI07_04665 [Bradyrhizobium sp. CCBAU 11445]|nr:hypothetical protein [Bradyrhizobium sp. CCBAU 11445]